MDKVQLINTIKKLLDVEDHLDFLEKLTGKELETLIACIRDGLDNPPMKHN